MQNNGTDRTLTAFTILKVIKRRKLYFLIPMLLLTAGAAIYALRLPTRFRARALVAVEPVIPQRYVNLRTDAAAAASVQDQLRSIRETLFSRPLLETVIREFGLYGRQQDAVPESAIEDMKSKIDVQVEGPDAFYLGFEGSNPQQVMQVTNRVAQLFVEGTSNLRGQQVQQATTFLDAEVERLRKQLTDQEQREEGYKQRAADELPANVQDNLRIVGNLQAQVQNKTDRIGEDQARRAAVVEEIKALEKQGGVGNSSQTFEKSATDGTVEELRLKLAQLKARYTSKYPEIVRTEKEIRDLEAGRTPAAAVRGEPSPARMRYFDLRAELQSIDQRLKSYRQEQATLTAEMQSYQRRVRTSPKHEMVLAQLTRDSSTTRSAYEAMLAKQQEARLDQQLQKGNKGITFKVVEPADLPSAPYSPKRPRIILLGFLASLGIGVMAVLFAEQTDSSFHTIEDVQGFTNLPVLSAIPTIAARMPASRSSQNGNHTSTASVSSPLQNAGTTPADSHDFRRHRLTVLSNPQSLPSEQYGILALKVRQWVTQNGAQVLVVTSAASGEGKSLTAVNLSLALSRSMEGRVLLLDGDLRRPQVHKCLNLNTKEGFSDLLLRPDDDISRYVSKIGNLYIMPGGTEVASPVSLLASRRTAELLARLRKEFRFIVVDSPPIMPVADAHIFAGLADGVVLIVRARQTQRELFQRAVESLSASNTLGLVLNDVQLGDTRYAYAYHYQQKQFLGAR